MGQFSETIIQQVWEKGTPVVRYNPNIWRKDFAGAWMRKDLYGSESIYGWEVDHLNPVAKGGSDNIDNLNPLQWKNNRTKADNYPEFHTAITSQENINIEKIQSWIVQ